jgi:hypothetical protein
LEEFDGERELREAEEERQEGLEELDPDNKQVDKL